MASLHFTCAEAPSNPRGRNLKGYCRCEETEVQRDKAQVLLTPATPQGCGPELCPGWPRGPYQPPGSTSTPHPQHPMARPHLDRGGDSRWYWGQGLGQAVVPEVGMAGLVEDTYSWGVLEEEGCPWGLTVLSSREQKGGQSTTGVSRWGWGFSCTLSPAVSR